MGVVAELAVGIVADVSGITKGFADTEKLATKFSKTMTKVSKNFTKVGKNLTVKLTVPLIALGAYSLKVALQTDRLTKSLEALAGGAEEAAEFIDSIKEASYGTISEVDALQISTKALTLGVVDNAEAMGKLVGVAITLGQAQGLTATQAVDDLTTALGRQSPMILDNLGITLKLTEAYDIYAEQLGKSVDELTSAEKQQAFLNAAMAKGVEVADRLGGVNDDSAASVERLTATWSDLRGELGEIMLPILQKVANKITEWMEAFKALDPQTKKTILIVAGIAAAIGPALIAIGKLALGIKALGTAFTFLAANPIVLLITGIAAAAFGAYKALDWLGDVTSEWTDGLQESVDSAKNLADSLESGFDPATALAGAINLAGSALTEFATGAASLTPIALASIIDRMRLLKDEVLLLPVDQMADAWTEGVDAILSEVNNLPPEVGSIMDAVVGLFDQAAVEAAKADLAGPIEAVPSAAEAAIEAIVQLTSRYKKFAAIDLAFTKQTGAGWIGLHDRSQATFDLFTKELPKAEELLLTLPPAIEDWTEANHELGDSALETVDTALGAYSQLASSVQGIYQQMFDGIANMLAGNEAAEEAHSASLISINKNNTDTLGKLAKDRTADLAAELVALNAGEISREEYGENIAEINKKYTQAVIDADTARTDSREAADAALEESKTSMKEVLKEMAHDFVTAIRNQMLAIAAQETVLALVAAAMLNWVGAAEHGIAAAAALGAALILTGISASFAEGGIVTGPTVGLLGEAGVSEAAIPLTKENLAGIGAGIANVMGSQPQQLAAVGGVTINFYDTTVRSDDDIREIVYGVQGVYEESERSSGVVRVVK